MAQGILGIEVDTPRNGNLWFYPADGLVRGRFLMARFGKFEKNALQYTDHPLAELPGQRIVIDFDQRKAFIHEPLADAEHERLRKVIEKGGQAIPEHQEFDLGLPDAEYDRMSTWLYWMGRAVQEENARVVSGELPAKLPGTPRKRFIGSAAEDNEQLFKRMIAILWAKLSPKERQEAEQLISAG